MLPRFFASVLIVLAMSTQADDCMVSTSPPNRLASLDNVVNTADSVDTGVFTVSFSNGDQIIAEYGTCDLALNAHFLIQSADKPDTSTIEGFLTAVIPAQAQAPQLVAQLGAAHPLRLNQPVHLKGTNDSHTLVLKPASSPLFQYELHYRWQPPLH